MGKRKKDSNNRRQPTSCAQDVMLHNISMDKACPGEGNEKTKCETRVYGGISPTSLLSTAEMTWQTMNKPLQMDSKELHDVLHKNKKHLPTHTENKCTIKLNDKTHQVSGETETNIQLSQEKSPSCALETDFTDSSVTSEGAVPTVTALSEVIDQQNVTATSTKKIMQKHPDSYGNSKSMATHEDIKAREIITKPTEFLKPTTLKLAKCKHSTTNCDFLHSQDTTKHSHYTLSKKNTMKTGKEIYQKKKSIPDTQKMPQALLMSTALLNDAQNSPQIAGPTNQENNEEQQILFKAVTKPEIITEKRPATKVSQCGLDLLTRENTETQNTDNKQLKTEVSKEMHVSKQLTARISTLSPHDYESNTTRTDTGIPQIPANMKTDPLQLTEKWPTLPITGLKNSVTHQKSNSPVNSTVNFSTKSEQFQNEETHVGLAATTQEADISNNASSMPISSQYPTQKTKCYLSQDTEVVKLHRTATQIPATKAAVVNGSGEDANMITNVSQSTQKSEHISIHVDGDKETVKAVPLLSSSSKATLHQGSAIKEADVDIQSQSSFPFLGHSTLNSKGSPSHAVMVAGSSKEVPVKSLTMQSSASTIQSTQNLLFNATNHGAGVSEFGTETAILSLTTNSESQKLLAASSMSANEAPSVVEDSNTTEKIQVCGQAGIKEMLNNTTHAQQAKQHTTMDTAVSNTSLPAESKALESVALPNMGGLSKNPGVLLKQPETQKKCSSSIKQHVPVETTRVEEKGMCKTGRKCNHSTHKTQETHEIEKTAIEIVKEAKKSNLVTYNNTLPREESSYTKDVQIPDKTLATKKDEEFITNITSVSKNSIEDITAVVNDKTVDSKGKQENKGKHISHNPMCSQFSNNKEKYKVSFHENKTDTRNSQINKNGVINHTNNILQSVKADGDTNEIFTYKENHNKVCEKETKPVRTNKDIKTDMNIEANEKSKRNVYMQSNVHDLRSNEKNQNNSIPCNKNVIRHTSKNTQNSTIDLLVNTTNKDEINDQAQQKKKKSRISREKNNEQDGNNRDLRHEKYVDNETCASKEERTEFQMHPETMKVTGKQNETISGDSTQANNIVSATLSKEHLTQLARKDLQLSVSHDNSRRLPDIVPSLLAPKPTTAVSTKNNEAQMEHKLIQRHIFLTYVCHVCKSSESASCHLKRCSNCKMISYCSKEHQKEHWAAHKDLCKVISKICQQNGMANLFGKAVGTSPDEYRYYRSQCINKCEVELGRELYLWEKEMICYPQVCHTCYEFDIQKLTTCQKCHHVSYCTLSHLKTDHDIWCKEIQVYRDITIYQCHHGIIQPSLPDRSLQRYEPLTGNMKTFLTSTNTASEKSFLLQRLKLVALSDTATCPLTVLFSLQQCNFHLEGIKTLTIHLVGAEMQFEVDTLQKWELFLLHSIPGLSTLKIVFIGPELKADKEFNQVLGKNETCIKCNKAGRMVIYEFWRTLYHRFVISSDYQKPDIICAFNAGLYRLTDYEGKDTWSPTIKAMLEEQDIPVVVTEYTEKELPFDLQRIQNTVDSLEVIMPPTRNPFASLKPSLNFLSEEIVPVIFKNFYITILKRESV